ncbi:MAG: hypothetical protein CM15mP21_0760 [Hyphomicrobiales bacterium]|nr:MAG: hypothetical protein CM15mP21_0760 [Hyphomicrobiales bacterium]
MQLLSSEKGPAPAPGRVERRFFPAGPPVKRGNPGPLSLRFGIFVNPLPFVCRAWEPIAACNLTDFSISAQAQPWKAKYHCATSALFPIFSPNWRWKQSLCPLRQRGRRPDPPDGGRVIRGQSRNRRASDPVSIAGRHYLAPHRRQAVRLMRGSVPMRLILT